MARTSRKERAEETEVALKAAARRLFASRGYLNTKITDITAEAGRAAGSFYNHFASREELLESLLADVFAEADEMIAEVVGHSPDFTDRDAVRWHVAGFWRFYQRHLPEMVALRQAAMVDEAFARRLKQLENADNAHMLDHLDYVCRAGGTLPGRPEVVVSAIESMLSEFAYQWQVVGGPGAPSDEEAVETLTEFIHRAMVGGRAGSRPSEATENGRA